MKNILISLPLAFLLLSITAIPAQAQAKPSPTSSCQQIFGGGSSCVQAPSHSINKQVQNPDTKAFVDTLQATDPVYSSGQTVIFKLSVTNTDKGNLTALTVQDILPGSLTFSKGPGKYNAKTRTLQFTIDQLKPQETKTFFIEATVDSATKTSQKPICVINQAVASANGNPSQDNTQVCLKLTQQTQKKETPPSQNTTTSKGGLPIHPPSETKKTPETGPEALAVIGLLPAGALGMWFRKKSVV